MMIIVLFTHAYCFLLFFTLNFQEW